MLVAVSSLPGSPQPWEVNVGIDARPVIEACSGSPSRLGRGHGARLSGAQNPLEAHRQALDAWSACLPAGAGLAMSLY